jgi:hypothetical protein
MHWPATFPISREGRRFITFIITLFRGVGASVAHTWRGIRAVPLRACGALLDLARKREHDNSSSHFHAQTHGPRIGGNLAVRSAQAEERDHKIAQALLGGVNIFASNIARFRWRRPRSNIRRVIGRR